MVKKKDIRFSVLNKRNQISKKEWETNSHIIFEKVVTHSFFLEADIILCFLNYQTEVDTRDIIDKSWAMGKKVYVPRIDGDIMNFYLLNSYQELKEGFKGIQEPIGQDVFKLEHGLVIMPGVAFDKNCNRIGYGKGFYDRFLKKYPKLRTLAIAFESQIVDTIPSDEHDIKPEILITEENIYYA